MPAGRPVFSAELAEFVSDWVAYTPVLYSNMTTTRSSIAKTVNHAKYMKRGDLVIVHFDITAGAGSSNGVGVSLPFNAVERTLTVGVGGIFGASAPTQSGTVSLGPGTPTDTAILQRFDNGFVDIASGQSFRATLMYEPA